MVSALGRSSISGVTEGAETRSSSSASSSSGSSSKPYEFGRREARRSSGPASSIRAGRSTTNRGDTVDNEHFLRNADLGDSLDRAIRGQFGGNGRSGKTFLVDWFAAVSAAQFYEGHVYKGEPVFA